MATQLNDIVFRNVSVVNRSGVRLADVAIRDGRVSSVSDAGTTAVDGRRVLDCGGLHMSSGFVDLHTHLREPGREESETIETGSRAAARGGFTAVVAMPNTDPSQDSVVVVEFVRAQGVRARLCEVVPSGCITVGRLGTQLAPLAALAGAGVSLFTDDGSGVQDPLLMRRALEYARDLDITLAQHCEVARLTEGAVMHEGSCCSRLGVPGWPSIAEELMLHRDIELVRLTGSPMHFLHLSTAGSVELVRRAKADGLPVTAEVTPHHLSLIDELLADFDPVFKVNPPLRTVDDIAALKDGLADGTIDAVATDHAPHAEHTKEVPLDAAPPGMLGLETALGVVNTAVALPVMKLVEVMSWNPARIARLEATQGHDIAVGAPANIAVFSLDDEWTVSRDSLASKSRNTPYHGMTFKGKVRYTVFNGELVVDNGEATR